jgi:murein DD-endopeptidase MepM/ murein hydrolase activator NlpD
MVCPRRNPRRVGTPLAPALLFTLTAACESDRVAPRAITGVTVSIAPAETILAIGSSATLIAEVRDADGQALTGRTITWGTSAPEITAVTDAGLVRALAPGRSTISAFSEPGLGLALVVVQEDLRLPLPGGRHWLLLAETGTSAGVCAEGEGGLRHTGDRECSHAGVSRYSLDFAAVTEQDGALAGSEVLAAADGRVIDVCILPQAINCGPEGAFVLMEHRGGLRTLYGHLDGASIMVRRKTALARGQQVGRTAASSTEPAPWVHFELRFENRGAQAASALEALLVDGRKLREYRVAPGQQRFYPSSNAAAGRLPDE